ncbi:MAG: hypothetical protein PHF24_00365 [Syntrophomonas sp.]|nr:hypothetical protein [Syntrophomonas sp.]
MENENRAININITINQEEYDELMTAIEYAMANISDSYDLLKPFRDRCYEQYGRPSWYKGDEMGYLNEFCG